MFSDNIEAGAGIVAGITANLGGDVDIAKVATLHNNLNATKVSDYGARVAEIYREQLWKNNDLVNPPMPWPADAPFQWNFRW
jgi:hypothetical protein